MHCVTFQQVAADTEMAEAADDDAEEGEAPLEQPEAETTLEQPAAEATVEQQDADAPEVIPATPRERALTLFMTAQTAVQITAQRSFSCEFSAARSLNHMIHTQHSAAWHC